VNTISLSLSRYPHKRGSVDQRDALITTFKYVVGLVLLLTTFKIGLVLCCFPSVCLYACFSYMAPMLLLSLAIFSSVVYILTAASEIRLLSVQASQ